MSDFFHLAQGSYFQGSSTLYHVSTRYSPLWLNSIPLYDYITIQFSSVAQSCPTLCNLMDCSTPGLPVHHQLPEFTEIHAH